MQVRPFRTLEDRIEGVVITLVDIDEVKKLRERLSLDSRDTKK